MAEYSRFASGKFTSTGSAQVVNLPFQPNYVEFINYSSAATPANHGVPFAKWDVNMGQGFAVEEVFNATPVLTTDIVSSNGISSFSAGLLLQYGPSKQIVASTKGTTTSFQVTSHGYAVGDVVLFEGLYQSSTTGMPQMAGMPFTVATVTDANNFVVFWNSNNSSYTNLSASPTGSIVKKILYPYLYFPGVAYVAAVTTGTTTTIDTTHAHNFKIGQEVAFRIPSNWGTTQLNSLPNVINPGSPIYGYVVSVTDYNTFVVNIDSSSFTAFTTAVAVSAVNGLTFPQVVAVGDVNTGGIIISSGSALYPSPSYIPISTTEFSTINGPGIRGAYCNNTSQGFIIGAGAGATDTSSVLVGANGNVIYWRASLSDM